MVEDIELRGRIIKEGELYILFEVERSQYEQEAHKLRVSLPKSQIAVVHDVRGRVKVAMPVWLAKAQNLY